MKRVSLILSAVVMTAMMLSSCDATKGLVGMIISWPIGSTIFGLILWVLAKNVGKISNATFGNSFLVCLVSIMINFAIWSLIGTDPLRFKKLIIKIGPLIVLIILSVSLITVGKFIWKCKWMQSIKANIIWIIVYIIVYAVFLRDTY